MSRLDAADDRVVFDPEEPLELLHVEDDDQFAETMATYLEDAVGGFVVTCVDDAEAALESLSTTTVDCVVSDYQMPGMNGIELSRAVAERAPHLPFVLLTGRGSEAVAREAVDAAVTSYLPKRADREGFERLAERIRDAVARAHTAVSYREVFDKAGVGLTVREPETGQLLAVNDTYCETLGYDREQVLADADPVLDSDGRSPTQTTRGGSAADATDTDGATPAGTESTTASGDPAAAWNDDRTAAFREAVETGVGTATWPVRDADGERMWLDVRYEVAAIGGTERVLGSLRDATARRELSDRTEQVATLHDAATRIQRCEMTDSVYEEVVAAAEEILEFDISVADELVGDTLYPRAVSAALSEDEYYETTPLDAEDNLAARACRTGEPSVVADLTRRPATPADTEFRAALTVPIGEHGVFQAVSRAVGAFDESDLELTELLAAHAREALSRLKRERELRERTRELQREKERSEVFASAVSHDLRNPLNVATGHLQMARKDSDDDHLATVADALDRIETITEDVLTIAREGATVESPEAVVLAALVDDCWGNVDTTDAALQVQLPERFTIGADPRRLRHVLENLFRNAVDHAGPEPTIELGALSEADGFYVADDGPGIESDSREAVFQPGYSTAANGTGFGLAIVGEMAGAHGWDVSVTASADGGARFEFTGVDTEPTG